MTVTALFVWRIEGRQMCSSTPRVCTPWRRSGLLMRRSASAPIASQAVCQSTPRCRAIAETVVSSCRNASTAHAIARVVSLDRAPAYEWSSVHVDTAQAFSAQRQIRVRHRTSTGRPKHGVSFRRTTRRPWPTATTPAGAAAREYLAGLDIEHHSAVVTSGHIDDMDAIDTEEFISPGASRRTRTTSRVSHSRPSGTFAWSLPILGGLELFPPYATPTVTSDSTTLNSEEPVYDTKQITHLRQYLDQAEAERIKTDLDLQFNAHGPRPADDVRSVDPPQAVEHLTAWESGELDAWIRDGGQWLGRVRDRDGHVARIPQSDLRPAGQQTP